MEKVILTQVWWPNSNDRDCSYKNVNNKGFGGKVDAKKVANIFYHLIFTKEKLIKPAGTRSVLSNIFVAEA